MSKKVSLKDAFVRSGAAENSPSPVQQETIASVAYEGMRDERGPVDTGKHTPVPPVVQPAVSLPIQQATFPHSQPAVSLYNPTVAAPPPGKKKATFNLNAALHQRLKIAAAIHSREMVDIVEDALQAYLPALDQKAG